MPASDVVENRASHPPLSMAAIGYPGLAVSPAVFGGLILENSGPLSSTVPPQVITDYTEVSPRLNVSGLYPEGVNLDEVAGTIEILYESVYVVSFACNVQIPAGTLVTVGVFADNGATYTEASADASNQTGLVHLSGNFMAGLQVGTILDLRYFTGAPATITLSNIFFSIFAIR